MRTWTRTWTALVSLMREGLDHPGTSHHHHHHHHHHPRTSHFTPSRDQQRPSRNHIVYSPAPCVQTIQSGVDQYEHHDSLPRCGASWLVG